MPDTVRTQSAILSLFADNSTGAISEQDLRDFVVTTMGCYGGLYLNYSGSPVAITANTYTVVNTQWDSAMQSDNVTCNATVGTLAIAVAGDYLVGFSMSGTANTNQTVLHHGVFVNGVESLVESVAKIGAGGDVQAFSATGILALAAAQVLDLRVKADKNCSYAPEHGQVWCRMIG